MPKPKMFTEYQYNRIKKDRDEWREMYADQSIKTLQIPLLEKNLSIKESMLDEVCKQRDEARKSVESLSKDFDQSCMDIANLAENYNTLLLAFQNSAKLLKTK